MAQKKAIKDKINTVKSTQKITRAMEMVAVSKLRNAQQQMLRSKPYTEKLAEVVSHIALANGSSMHPFMVAKELKNIAYIIISSDSGLCGGLNNNLFRLILKQMQMKEKNNIGIDLFLIGTKANLFFKRYGGRIIGTTEHLGNQITLAHLIGIIKVALKAYLEQKVNAIYLCYNVFVSTMTQNPTIKQLLPITHIENAKTVLHWDYIYEPEAKSLLDLALTRYVESQVYQAVVENHACKQAAQMIAMKNATDNAGKIVDQLNLIYNKARQAIITQELAEIIAGREALED